MANGHFDMMAWLTDPKTTEALANLRRDLMTSSQREIFDVGSAGFNAHMAEIRAVQREADEARKAGKVH